MLKRFLTGLFIFASISTISAQDTIVVHAVNLEFKDGLYTVDGSIVKADVYKKLKAEQDDFMAKTKGKIYWVRRLNKNNKLVEQGLFCDGTTPVGNVIRYNELGQILYKKIFGGTRVMSCSQSLAGTKATEEIFDLVNGLRIYGTYQDGIKHGQFLYYAKENVVGAEAYENGKLIKRRGKVFSVTDKGTFKIEALTN